MDLGFTLHDTRQGGWTSDCGIAPDWQDLLPRLHAGWSARRELLAMAGGNAPRRGNFDPASAQMLCGYKYASHLVNPTASANRKPVGGIDMPVAGNSDSGARG